jgi:hypothetical protein
MNEENKEVTINQAVENYFDKWKMLKENFTKNNKMLFNKLQPKNMVKDLTEFATDFVVSASTSGEQAAIRTAKTMLLDIASQIKGLIADPETQQLVKDIQLFFENVFKEIKTTNDFFDNNMDDIKKFIKNYITIIYSPFLIRNQIYLDSIILAFIKILNSLEYIPGSDYEKINQGINILKEIKKNPNIIKDDKLTELSEIFSQELINLNKNINDNLVKKKRDVEKIMGGGKLEKNNKKNNKQNSTKKKIKNIHFSIKQFNNLNKHIILNKTRKRSENK